MSTKALQRRVGGLERCGSGGWIVGDVVLLEEGQGVVDRDGGAESGRPACWGGSFRLRDRGRGMQPTAFDDADDLVGVAGDDWCATLPAENFVAEEKKLGLGLAFVEFGGEVLQDFGRGLVFLRGVKGVGILEVCRAQGFSEDCRATRRIVWSERKECDLEFRGEGIGSGAENGYVVLRIDGDDFDFAETGRSVGPAQQDGRQAAIAEVGEYVGGGDEVAVVINEEGVAVEDVVDAAFGGFVERVDEWTDGEGDGGVGRRCRLGCRPGEEQDGDESGEDF